MEKRYQVFISSTFQDLKNARQEVSQALLRADCFPAGMELFPAADEEQFEFIKTIIDQSDYYIIISAGRYGSIHPETGLSYTEMEYDYAVEIGKPVIRLLHKDPFNELKGEFIEKSDAGREALEKFREKMCVSSLVRFWEVPKELGIEVLIALTDLKRRSNAIGWVPGNSVLDGKAAIELADLRQKLSELEAQKAATAESELPASMTYDLGIVENWLKKFNANNDSAWSFHEIAKSFSTLQDTTHDINGKPVFGVLKSSLNELMDQLGDLEFRSLIIALKHEEFLRSEFAKGFETVFILSSEFRAAAAQADLVAFLES